MRRCGFFFDVFNLELPDYLKCSLFSESSDPDECVGHFEVIEAKKREKHPTCSGFLCDQRRCIPSDWRCDGHVDCHDQTDEFECDMCGNGTIYCGGTRCMSQKHVCDGVSDCPFGQDERNCSEWFNKLTDRWWWCCLPTELIHTLFPFLRIPSIPQFGWANATGTLARESWRCTRLT